MRWAIVQLTALTLVVLVSAHAEARVSQSDKVLCQQVRDALAAGRTLDQITAELHIDAKRVAKCVQPRAHGGAKRKSSKPSSTRSQKGHDGKAPAARAPKSDARTSPPPQSRSAVGHIQP